MSEKNETTGSGAVAGQNDGLVTPLKCYYGGSTDPFEYDFVEACFAHNREEAWAVVTGKADAFTWPEGQ